MTSKTEQVLNPLLGAISSFSIGSLLFQGLGALFLGILGAIGGWLFTRFLKPKLEKLFKK